MNELLRVKNLKVEYGGITALKEISFEVHQGEIVALIGANGAGKTTTLGALSGLVPYRGTIELIASQQIGTQWINLATLQQHNIVREGIAHCPEGRGVFPNLTVYENLFLGAFSRDDKEGIEKDIRYCYSLFPRLEERKKQKSGTLSGGEQQMLAISRALMAKPRILLLDEPSLGLAPLIVSQIFEIIKRLNSEGITILLVEQNAKMALRISHRAYCIETGKIVLSGTGEDLLTDPRVISAYLGGAT